MTRKGSRPSLSSRIEDAKSIFSVAETQQQGATAMRCYNCRKFGHYMKDCSQTQVAL